MADLLYWETPATLSITAPADATKVSGPVLAQVTTAAPGATAVRLYLDGQLLGQDTDGSDGWAISWDSTAVSDGSHTLVAVATDGASQLAGNAIVVGVNNQGGAVPWVRILEPYYDPYNYSYEEPLYLTGVTSLLASAVDLGPVAGVKFFYGENLIGVGAPTADGNWSCPWDTTGFPDGQNDLTAVATGAGGALGSSFPIPVVLQNRAIHIGDLDRASAPSGNLWVATVWATVHDVSPPASRRSGGDWNLERRCRNCLWNHRLRRAMHVHEQPALEEVRQRDLHGHRSGCLRRRIQAACTTIHR